MIETLQLVEPWIWSRLSGDPTILDAVGEDSISGTLSAEALTPPYITFSMNSTRDVMGIGGVRISTDNLYLVKVVGLTGSWNAVGDIATRIDELFHLPYTTMTVPGGSLSSVREQTISYPEVDGGVQYRHLGGLYRIRASAD